MYVHSNFSFLNINWLYEASAIQQWWLYFLSLGGSRNRWSLCTNDTAASSFSMFLLRCIYIKRRFSLFLTSFLYLEKVEGCRGVWGDPPSVEDLNYSILRWNFNSFSEPLVICSLIRRHCWDQICLWKQINHNQNFFAKPWRQVILALMVVSLYLGVQLRKYSLLW